MRRERQIVGNGAPIVGARNELVRRLATARSRFEARLARSREEAEIPGEDDSIAARLVDRDALEEDVDQRREREEGDCEADDGIGRAVEELGKRVEKADGSVEAEASSETIPPAWRVLSTLGRRRQSRRPRSRTRTCSRRRPGRGR